MSDEDARPTELVGEFGPTPELGPLACRSELGDELVTTVGLAEKKLRSA